MSQSLTSQLNDLLQAIHIPILLLSPTDLTPSLLIAILESFLGTKISLIANQNPPTQIQNMKIFLGVLETDILQRDLGLSNVDPRRLSEGEWDEVVFVGELLCWVARRIGLLDVNPKVDVTPRAPQAEETPASSKGGCNKRKGRRRGVSEPYPPHPELDTESVFYCGSSTTTTKLTQQTLSSFELGESRMWSDTTVDYNDNEEELSDPSTPSSSFSFLPPPSTPPRCIHQIPSPSLLLSADIDTNYSFPFPPTPPERSDDAERSFCTCHPSLAKHLPIEHDHPSLSSSSVSPSVRRDGYIQQVDEDFEVESFERSRGTILLDTSTSSLMAGRDGFKTLVSILRFLLTDVMVDVHVLKQEKKRGRSKKLAVANREFERTLELLNERALLLSQLADLKKGRVLI
jgi:hypothetical protein